MASDGWQFLGAAGGAIHEADQIPTRHAIVLVLRLDVVFRHSVEADPHLVIARGVPIDPGTATHAERDLPVEHDVIFGSVPPKDVAGDLFIISLIIFFVFAAFEVSF